MTYIGHMDVEFDAAKDITNLAKHGVSLAIGRIVLEHRVGDVRDPRDYGGEVRRIAFGIVAGRLFVCVYTMRGGTHRIISVRKGNQRERRKWQR